MRVATDIEWIAERAEAIGFDLCGVAPAKRFPELARAEEWFAKGYAGQMKYLGDERRGDPARVLAGVRSVIVFGMNYNSDFPRSTEFASGRAGRDHCAHGNDGARRGWISRYAWGDDYHEVLWSRLNALIVEMRDRFGGEFQAAAYTDTGPLQERIFAKYAGLGWIGKNTLILNQRMGSLFFLGAVLTTLELAPSLEAADSPPRDLCGSCTRCIDACPTGALIEPYQIDARRCISYLTIEYRGSIPEELREGIGNHVYGCDICQDVCPWNRRAPATSFAEFQPRTFQGSATGGVTSLFRPDLAALAGISEEEYRVVFRGSAIKRSKHRGTVRNACIALGNAKFERGAAPHQEAIAVLQRLSASNDPVISESAHWALSRIQ